MTPRSTERSARWAPGSSRRWDRHLGDPHGVVRRTQGAAFLRDRLPPTGRRRLGSLLGGQRHRCLPGVGPGDRARLGRGPLSRAYSAGIVALRPSQDGRIQGYSGVDEIQQRHGPWILDAHLPDPGSGTQPVEAGYMANAWVRMRHPDYDTLRGMLDDVGRTIQVHAG